MGSIKFQVQMGGTLARLTLNRVEKKNAFDREMLRELGDLVRGVEESESVRVLTIEGAGEAFSMGSDLAAATASDSVSNYLGSLSKAFHAVIESLAESSALIVTVVNGPAVADGMALALAGDLRLGTPAAKFRLGFGRSGLTVEGGLSWRLPRLIGTAQAQRLLFEDPDVEAEEARQIGLLHQVVPEDGVQKALEDVIAKTKLQARASIFRNRELLMGSLGRPLVASLEAETMQTKTSAATVDGREGIQATLENRPPQFRS